MTTEGIEFINAKPDQVIDYLKKREVKQLAVSPSNLLVKNSGRQLILRNTASGKEYPLRRSFLYKLLKWYSFPLQQLQNLSGESVAGICNDFLLQMSGGTVQVKIENDDALTITSKSYTEITDLEIISRLSAIKINSISRNDFMLKVNLEERHKLEPVQGDLFGFGLIIINSETGFRALRISHYILRYICSNGASMQINAGKGRIIHYGKRKEELTEFINRHVEIADTRMEKLNESIRELRNKPADKNDPALKKIFRVFGKNAFKLSNIKTHYDLFNLVTEEAKLYDLSKRIYLEELAGRMISVC